jgi:hypothetical protein
MLKIFSKKNFEKELNSSIDEFNSFKKVEFSKINILEKYYLVDYLNKEYIMCDEPITESDLLEYQKRGLTLIEIIKEEQEYYGFYD